LENLVRDAVSYERNLPTRTEDAEGPKIVVIGCGGAGNNSVNRLARIGISGAELIALNTDKQHLTLVHDSVKKLLIGQSVTKGLGAGGYPEVGAKSAEVSRASVAQILEDSDLVFLTAGMGGGTGTGSAPIVADIAKEQGAIVVAMVTFPFLLERARIQTRGRHREAPESH
jgi:cell division protein FtsZ